jgi:hypothetical protein
MAQRKIKESWQLTGDTSFDWLLWSLISIMTVMWVPIVGMMFNTPIPVVFLPFHFLAFVFCLNEAWKPEGK